MLEDQLAGAAWTEQLILRKQDLAKLLTYTKAPKIFAVTGLPKILKQGTLLTKSRVAFSDLFLYHLDRLHVLFQTRPAT